MFISVAFNPEMMVIFVHDCRELQAPQIPSFPKQIENLKYRFLVMRYDGIIPLILLRLFQEKRVPFLCNVTRGY